MKYSQRLKLARKHKNLSQDALSKISGVGQGSISKIERGDQEVSAFDIELAHVLNVSPLWLKTGDKKHTPDWIDSEAPAHSFDPESNVQINAENLDLVAFLSIPVVGVAQLNDNAKWTEIEHPTDFKGGIIDFPTRDKNAYALKCIGDSMAPRIRDGEFVVIEPNTEPQPGDDVLLKATDGRVMVKTFLYKREDKIHLISVNNAHPPHSIHISEVDKMHYVLAAVRRPSCKSK